MRYEIHFCNTFFITDEHLLTAADCLTEFYNDTINGVFQAYFVRIRRSNQLTSDHSINQVEIIDKPKYLGVKKANNIGIVSVNN